MAVIYSGDQEKISQYRVASCACQYGAGDGVEASGLPLLPNPYVPSSVSSRVGFCLVGVRRAVPECSLNDPQLFPSNVVLDWWIREGGVWLTLCHVRHQLA